MELTYVTYLLLAVGPPLVAAALAVRRRCERPLRVGASAAAMVAVAAVYTAPWDGHLIARGVWWYGEGVTTARIGRIPLGEYLFFGAQSTLTALTVGALLPDVRGAAPGSVPTLRAAGVWGASLLALAGIYLTTTVPGYYLGMILVWALPVVCLLWILGAPVLWRYRRAVAAGVLLPTFYLWVVDRVAIGLGLWTISGRYSTGVDLLGLPVEEAVFFLLTNCLVVAGAVLFRWVLARADGHGAVAAFGGLVPPLSGPDGTAGPAPGADATSAGANGDGKRE